MIYVTDLRNQMLMKNRPLDTGKKHVYVIIPAAGSGSRMRHDRNKQFIEINNQPVIGRTLTIFENHPSITGYFLVTAENDREALKDLTDRYQCSKLIDIVTGGPTRQISVINGLQALADYLRQHYPAILSHVKLVKTEETFLTENSPAKNKSLSSDSNDKKVRKIRKDQAGQPDPIVLIHDGARCFADRPLIDRVIAGIGLHDACGAAMPVKDTIKKVTTDEMIIETPERDVLRAMQTPQGACFKLLYQAYHEAEATGFSGTDDLSVLANAGIPVYTVQGSEQNIKITTPFDLLIAEAICRQLDDKESRSPDHD